jgi:hypothetical protein
MKKFFVGVAALVSALSASTAFAGEDPTVVNNPPSRFRFLGMGFSVGAPSGVALGIIGRIPKINFLKLELDATHNGLAMGMKGDATLDFIKFPIAPTLTLSYGGNWGGQVPGVDKSPTVSYQYESALLGLEMGSRDSFRFFLRGGITHINVNASNLQKLIGSKDSSLTVGDATLSAWAAPAAQLGFQWLF